MKKLIDLQDFTVLRADPADEGYYDDNGDWIEGDNTTAQFDIQGSLQPITGNDLQLLPDGLKRTDVRKLYTKTELRSINDDTEQEADKITIDGSDYEVHSVEKWVGRRLQHYKVLLVKEEKTG